MNDLLEVGVDGVVIATPGALDVAQAVTALERGVALCFQHPVDKRTIPAKWNSKSALPFVMDVYPNVEHHHLKEVKATARTRVVKFESARVRA